VAQAWTANRGQETKVTLGTASGNDLGAIGKVHIKVWLEDQTAEFDALLATKARKCLLSGIKLREGGLQGDPG
jgi:hypothetical protein